MCLLGLGAYLLNLRIIRGQDVRCRAILKQSEEHSGEIDARASVKSWVVTYPKRLEIEKHLGEDDFDACENPKTDAGQTWIISRDGEGLLPSQRQGWEH